MWRMSSAQRVPIPLRNKISVYLGIIFIGLPALGIWVFIHLSAIDLICDCVPYNIFTEWTPTSIWIAGLLTLIPLIFADWFVSTQWRSYRMERKILKSLRGKTRSVVHQDCR